jgi:thiamine-phosphate pyrophosphorylase
MIMISMISKLQYISPNYNDPSDLDEVRSLCANGLNWVQLRLKGKDQTFVYEMALRLKQILVGKPVQIILNDYPEIAAKLDLDGVHLGKKDMNIRDARVLLGPNKIIGGTANTHEDVLELTAQGVNYIGLGPYKFTKTKKQLSPILGIEGYSSIIAKLKEGKNLNPPIYAIGGIEVEDISKLMTIGVNGIAVSGLLANTLNRIRILERIQFVLDAEKSINKV